MPTKWKGRQRAWSWGSEGRVYTAPIQLRACPPAPPEPLGADAFLPALTEELIWSPHIGETQLDVEFLMELLDPEELRGEGEAAPQKRRDPTGGALGPSSRAPQQGGRRTNCRGTSGDLGSRRAALTTAACP